MRTQYGTFECDFWKQKFLIDGLTLRYGTLGNKVANFIDRSDLKIVKRYLECEKHVLFFISLSLTFVADIFSCLIQLDIFNSFDMVFNQIVIVYGRSSSFVYQLSMIRKCMGTLGYCMTEVKSLLII